MSDPTMALVDAIRRADESEWAQIITGVPIFVAHSWWERTTESGKESKAVMFGDDDPDEADGWKKIYEVTESDLEEVKDEINKRFESHATPMKLLLGHSRAGATQEDQPALVGYGAKARMGTFGPKKIKAVLADKFFKKGHEGVAAEYPQRSPEFKQSAKLITGIALLKTDPRLPMGMHAYESKGDVFLYGEGFMADDKKPDNKPVDAPGGDAPLPPAVAAVAPAPAPVLPTAPPTLSPELMQQIVAYMEANHGAFQYMCEQFKQYSAAQVATAPAAPAAGASPAVPIGNENSEGQNMSDDEEKRLYEERIHNLELTNATMYAEGEVEILRRKRKIADPKKLKEKFIKARIGADHEVACKELREEILNNYAILEKPPIGDRFLPVAHDTDLEAPTVEDDFKIDDPEIVQGIVKYGEENKIDCSTKDGWDKALNEFKEKQKKKKPQRQPA